MTISSAEELDRLKAIGRIVADTIRTMREALEPGITPRELDRIGAGVLAREGAVPAPASVYGFPAATCISVNTDIAHGIPGEVAIAAGDLVNIDVSASKDGIFADAGASFLVPPGAPRLERLVADGRRALSVGIAEARAGRPLAGIGNAIGRFARERRYTLVRNLASHGIGRSLHEEPKEIATWPDPRERRRISDGLVFTIEPFLSLGATWAVESGDGWTLRASPAAPTVQFEHTVVATKGGPLIVTRAP
jgi:methionyl aminopeptidase